MCDNKGKINRNLNEHVQDAFELCIKILLCECSGKCHRTPIMENLFLPWWTFILSSGEGTLENLAFSSQLITSCGRIEKKRKARYSKSNKKA